MNLKTRLRHIAAKLELPRGYGKTTVLAKAAKELDGTLLVAKTDEATHLKRQGFNARSIDVNLEGFSGPFFLDNHAAAKLLERAANKIEMLEIQLSQFVSPLRQNVDTDEVLNEENS